MSEISITKFLQKCDQNFCVMESCHRLYTWINYTVFMILLQILWKMSQISDYFNRKSDDKAQDARPTAIMEIPATSKEIRRKRHIRSMSDVQKSITHYTFPRHSRKYSYHSLAYDSDNKIRRIRNHYNRHRYLDSSDSSDYTEIPKHRTIVRKITKPTDTMRFL